MSATSKGSRWRLKVQRFLGEAGFASTFKPWMAEGADVLVEDPRVVIECKWRAANHNWWKALDQAVMDSRDGLPVAWLNRPGVGSPGEAAVIMRGEDFVQLLGRAVGR